MTWPIRTWFVKRISITCWLSFATGEFEGAKNNVWGFANRLIRILSVVMRSLVNETRAFLLSVSICLGVGIPILKDAEKKRKDFKIYVKHEMKNSVKETESGSSYKRKMNCLYWTPLGIVTIKLMQ